LYNIFFYKFLLIFEGLKITSTTCSLGALRRGLGRTPKKGGPVKPMYRRQQRRGIPDAKAKT
jgi:hypothetical protein